MQRYSIPEDLERELVFSRSSENSPQDGLEHLNERNLVPEEQSSCPALLHCGPAVPAGRLFPKVRKFFYQAEGLLGRNGSRRQIENRL